MGLLTRLHMLTPRQVLAAEDGDQADGGGLVLRIGAGRVSWVLRYTGPAGKRREMGLGVAYRDSLQQAGESLVAAREQAQAARELLRTGVDPLDQREQRRQEAAQAVATEAAARAEREALAQRESRTLARVAREYHARVIEPTRSSRHGAQWISSLENHIPAALWHAPIDTITAPALLAALQEIKPHERARNLKGDKLPETLRRIRQRLDTIFEHAIFEGWCQVNPATAVKRKLREAMPKRQAGQFAALDYRHAPALLTRLRAMPGTAARCLELAVLTAARTSEALLAEWTEFDLGSATWVVPGHRMKRGEPHTVFLSPRVVEILRAQAGQDARFVFPSPVPSSDGKARPLSNMAMLKTLQRLGVRDQTTVHGLARATFSTWAAETGAARPDVVEACLAHSEADLVRKAYMRAQFNEERRELLQAWAGYLSRPALVLAA